MIETERIGELEKRVTQLETILAKLSNQHQVYWPITYEPAPYWQNPNWKLPNIT